ERSRSRSETRELPSVDTEGWPLDARNEMPTPDAEGWPLFSSESQAMPALSPSPAPVVVQVQQMPSPAAAAYEAARIVGEMVGDIESAPGAALMAAAAAGAAIEVARARVAAGEPDRSLASSVSLADAASTDPVITERMQRDRILRAL